MTELNIRNHYQDWKTNRVEKIEDYLWYMFNYLLNENAKESQDIINFYKRNDEIYIEMLYFRRKVEGKPANEIQRLLNRNRIELQIESSPYEFDVIINFTKDCQACENLKGTIISAKEALENKFIPYNQCTRKRGYACLYSIKPKRNKDGRLIKKL